MTVNKRLLLNTLIVCFIVAFAACTTGKIVNYYIIDYNPVVKEGQKLEEAYPYRVQIKEMGIDKTYDNSSIVVRLSAHKLYYDKLSLWAVRPQEVISNLIQKHVRRRNIFQSCELKYYDKRPDYVITGYIDNIEKYRSKNFMRADIQMTLFLETGKGNEILVTHRINELVDLTSPEMDYFSKKISDVLKKHIDIFLNKVISYMQSNEAKS